MSEPPVGVPVCYRHPDRESHIRCQRCERPICPDCMRDAAVGFQCPVCVAEGRRSMRVGKTPYGGDRSNNPALTSYVLIALNAVVWLSILATGWHASTLTGRLALRVRGVCDSAAAPDRYYPGANSETLCDAVANGDGVWVPGVADGALWQLFTSAFTHVEVWHIIMNMLALAFIGPRLEQVMGRARFLALYLLSAASGSVSVYWFSALAGYTLGASGAIYGLLGTLLIVAWKVHGNDFQTIVIWLAALTVFSFVVPNISWQGHLGGLAGGLVFGAIIVFAPRNHRPVVQWGGLVVLVGVLLVATAARTLALL